MRRNSPCHSSLLPWVAIVFFFWCGGFLSGQSYRLGIPPPAWVIPLEPDVSAPVPAAQVSAGIYFLLDETQDDLLPGQAAHYSHQAYRIVNRSGTEHGGELQIDFDPAYQTLAVHRLRIIRDGRPIDMTGKVRPSLLQRESNLEYRIYDGVKTLSLILPDVREQDIVDYSYTLTGSNPVFGNRLSYFHYLQNTTGIKRLFVRVVAPSLPQLLFRVYNGDFQPAVSSRSTTVEYIWDLQDRPALITEENLPSWYNTFPLVQISQYADWRAVSDWALPLYDRALTSAKNIPALARRLVAGKSSREDRLAALVGFVQDDIRYLGIEMGQHSHQPTPPDTVLERRFGDCKDKSLLLTVLCRAQGFEAWPVLVNTWMRDRVSNYLPSPVDFNHVIVLIRENGREYWIDPTTSHQSRALTCITPADFGAGLVIRPGTTSLAAMRVPGNDEPELVITETYDLSRGNDAPAAFTVVMALQGAAADRQRRYFEEKNRQKIRQDSLAFYADLFKGIESSGELTMTDDRALNSVTITEPYIIHNPWTRDDEDDTYTFSLYPLDLGGYVQKPKLLRRTTPLALAHPVHVRLVKEIDLPKNTWDLKDESGEIKNDYFVFTQTATYRPWHVTYQFDYRSLGDHVPAAAVAGYAADLEKVRDRIDFVLSAASLEPDNAASASDTPAAGDDRRSSNFWFIIFPAAGITALFIGRLIRNRRRQGAKAAPFPVLICSQCGAHSTRESVRFYTRCAVCQPKRNFCSVCYATHRHPPADQSPENGIHSNNQ
jgi:transglutaminase-like putative cysteine protease